MIKKVLFIYLVIFSATTTLAEPMNLSHFKSTLINYYDSGKYQQQVGHTITQAQRYLTKKIINNAKLKHRKKLAIVLDIDETSLSNYPSLSQHHFCLSRGEFVSAVSQARDPALPYTLSLFNFAKQNHVAIFFVTGRSVTLRNATVRNLKAAGYHGWQQLYLRPKSYHQRSVIAYKTQTRKNISKQGYTVVLNIGDQWSDLKGGYAMKAFKLPNPFYFIA